MKDVKELDYYLQRKYSFSLWHFSLSLADNFLHWRDIRSIKKTEIGNLELSWINFWEKRKKELENLKNKNVKILEEFIKKTNPHFNVWLINREIEKTKKFKKRINSNSIDYIEKIFDLDGFFSALDELIEKINQISYISIKRGTPTKRINIIALIWSYFIKDENYVVEIIDLLDWFNKKFQQINQYKPFCAEVKNMHNEKLKKTIYRHRKLETYKSIIERGKNIFNYPIGSRIVVFGGNKIKITCLSESDWTKTDVHSFLVTFPDGEVLTVKDFKENSIRANVSYKDRTYKNIFAKKN